MLACVNKCFRKFKPQNIIIIIQKAGRSTKNMEKAGERKVTS